MSNISKISEKINTQVSASNESYIDIDNMLKNNKIFKKFYEEEYSDIYLYIVENSDVTESGEDWITPTEEDNEIMHEEAYKRAKKRFEELEEPSDEDMMSSFGTKWHDGL